MYFVCLGGKQTGRESENDRPPAIAGKIVMAEAFSSFAVTLFQKFIENKLYDEAQIRSFYERLER